MTTATVPIPRVETIKITKAQYFSLPNHQRKRQKDMSHWIRVNGARSGWVRAQWTS